MKDPNRKKFTATFLIAVLAVSFSLFPLGGQGPEYAYAVNDLSQQIDDNQDKLDENKEQQEEIKNELSAVADDIKELQGRVDNLNGQIYQAAQDIKNTEARVEAKKQEIKDKKAEIKQKKKEIHKREKGLNARLKVMYKNGSVGFVDVLLGSNSISEFVSNVEMIQKIYENDVDLLKILEKEHKKLEKEEKKLQEEKKELQAIEAELKTQLEALDAKKAELKVEQGKLDEKKKILEKKEDELKAEADALIKKIKELQDAQRVYEGGAFTWPVPSSTYISSSFGSRIHPVYHTWKFHTGTDIAASYGANIVAAASGKVIMSQWYGGYGNCVMIDHGSGIVTLYGHCSSRLVATGQEVARGQVIALVGSTGTSTGNHCHFEVRVNGQYVNPMSYFH